MIEVSDEWSSFFTENDRRKVFFPFLFDGIDNLNSFSNLIIETQSQKLYKVWSGLLKTLTFGLKGIQLPQIVNFWCV
jgi:hypothetical protein